MFKRLKDLKLLNAPVLNPSVNHSLSIPLSLMYGYNFSRVNILLLPESFFNNDSFIPPTNRLRTTSTSEPIHDPFDPFFTLNELKFVLATWSNPRRPSVTF